MKRNRGVYRVWHDIKRRCLSHDDKLYHRYGGRGIKIYHEWMIFENFELWALDNYKPGLQIHRIDNDGDYTPENCSFVTCAENVQNSSKAKIDMNSAKDIRKRYSSGQKIEEIEVDYPITRSRIYEIIANDSWHDPDYTYKKRVQKKLTDKEKEQARSLFQNGMTLKSLCDQFEVKKGTMHYILHGRSNQGLEDYHASGQSKEMFTLAGVELVIVGEG